MPVAAWPLLRWPAAAHCLVPASAAAAAVAAGRRGRTEAVDSSCQVRGWPRWEQGCWGRPDVGRQWDGGGGATLTQWYRHWWEGEGAARGGDGGHNAREPTQLHGGHLARGCHRVHPTKPCPVMPIHGRHQAAAHPIA
jgi:hypothetical protein